jgi:hypothetical protein
MKPVYRYDIEQNSDEWEEIKLGMFSASTCASLLMDKSTKGYQNLINKIVEERITGERCENDTFKGNWATERGHELESVARQDFELRNLLAVKLVGVVIMGAWTLCSPDGLIGDDMLHQIKNPIFSTQKEYLTVLNQNKELNSNDIMKKIDLGYYKQMQFELMVTDRRINVFTSFHPHLSSIDLLIARDEDLIGEIKARLEEAKVEVIEEIKRIKNLRI